MTADGLYRVKNSISGLAYLKPGADLAHYDEVLLDLIDLIDIAYKRPPRSSRIASPGSTSNFALTEAQMAKLRRLFREVFQQELERDGVFQLVNEPGPTVLRIDANVVDLVVRVPTQTTGGAGDRVYVNSAAALTLVLELRDSTSGEVLAANRRPQGSVAHGRGFPLLQQRRHQLG